MLHRCLPSARAFLSIINAEMSIQCSKNIIVSKRPTMRRLFATNMQYPTISEIIEQWSNRFNSEGIPEPVESIQHIVAHVTGTNKILDLVNIRDKRLTSDQFNDLEILCECRLSRMPVQYIIQEWDFRDITLKLVPPIFIPRPETEMLVHYILKALNLSENKASEILEIGCGSGAISLSIAHTNKTKLLGVNLLSNWSKFHSNLQTLPSLIFTQCFHLDTLWRTEATLINNGNNTRVFETSTKSPLQENNVTKKQKRVNINTDASVKCIAIDSSLHACELTIENRDKLGLKDQVAVVHATLNENGSIALTSILSGPKDLNLNSKTFDFLVSNPPYIPTKQIAALPPEIKIYEDLTALDGGEDGLKIIKPLLKYAATALKPGGRLLLEVDTTHPEYIKFFTKKYSVLKLQYEHTYKDFCNNDRFVEILKIS